MKMPHLPKFKIQRSRRKLEARARSAAAPMADDYDSEEPQTKLTSAFIVVLMLHVVAVGGIYAFNSIKASRGTGGLESLLGKREAAAAATGSAPDNPAAAPPVARPSSYEVEKGDTLTGIAKKFDLTIAELAAANKIKVDATLQIGRSLALPRKGGAVVEPPLPKLDAQPRPAVVASKPGTSGFEIYKMKKGDRILFIAKRYGVSPDELIAINKIKDPARLPIGFELKIPPRRGK